MMATGLGQDATAVPAGALGSATPSGGRHSEASATPAPSLQNRAGESASPYVRAHAETPVAWQLLDDQAIARARRENKLIFLNIGYRACHYCRLTLQDSFSNRAVADLLNESFIPIVVDREERPDIDAVYMNYIQAVNGAGGWPLNVFLTPELEPVFGGTYWPGPGTEHSRPAAGTAVTGNGGRGAASTTGSGSDVDDDDRLDFLVILRKLQKIWTEQESRCRKEAKEILLQLRDFAAEGTLGARGVGAPAGVGEASAAEPVDSAGSEPLGGGALSSPRPGVLDLDLDQLEEAYSHVARTFDPVNGGFGLAPKFPTPAKLSFLLRLGCFPAVVRDVVGEKEVSHAAHMALHTLRRIRDGGLRDHVGAGFARYSATADWAMPHFEKMVADNALLLNLYLDAWLCGAKRGQPRKEDEFADVVFELADYLTSPPVALESGGFASSEAADSYYRRGDSHVREGAYYLWTRREFDTVVGTDDEGKHASTLAAARWNVLEHGNVPREQDPHDEFINQNVLHVVKDLGELSKQFGIPEDQANLQISLAKERLHSHRDKERVRPEVDDKIVASYNGMVIASLARAAGVIAYCDGGSEKYRSLALKYAGAAEKAAAFIRTKMWDAKSKTLYRTYQEHEPRTGGFAEDYAFLIEGLLELYEVTLKGEWLSWADELQRIQIDRFYDRAPDRGQTLPGAPPRSSSGAFYSTAEPDLQIILRLKDGMDTAQPSTNAVSVSNLFRLGALLAEEKYTSLARETINAFEAEMLQYPWLFIGLLSGVVSARLGGQNLVIVDEAIGVLPSRLSRFYTSPRAALNTVLFLRKGEEKSWLTKRNPLLGKLAREKTTSGRYILEDGAYRPSPEPRVSGGR